MKILITGDFCPTENINCNCFKSIIPSFEECDLRIINFECSIYSENTQKILKEGPVIGCSKNIFNHIKFLPVDLFTLANNHTYDYGENGLKSLIENANINGIKTVGAGINIKDAQTPFYYNNKKLTLAIINCCECEFSIANNKHGGANSISPISIYNQIQTAKKNADIIIIIAHGGHEYYQLPSPRTQELYRFFADAGAHLIVGHHPHCYSGVERYKNSTIFYSLGNFYFKNHKIKNHIWNEGYMLKLCIDDVKHSNISYEIIPYIQCLDNDTISLMKGEKKTNTLKHIDKLSSIISDKKLLEKYFNQYVSTEKKKVLSRLLPYSNHYLIALYKRGYFPSFLSKNAVIARLNALQCEAHRDLTIENLKIILEQ